MLPWQLPLVPAGVDARPGAVRSYRHPACHQPRLSPTVATSMSPPSWPPAAGWAWAQPLARRPAALQGRAGAARVCRVWPRLRAVSLLPLAGCLRTAHCLLHCTLRCTLCAATGMLPAAAPHCTEPSACCCQHTAHCTLLPARCTLRTAARALRTARCSLHPAAWGVPAPGRGTREPTSPGILPALCQSRLGTGIRVPLSRAPC